MNQFYTEDFSDITKQPMEKLIKLRDRRKQNWMEMQKAASEEYRLMWDVFGNEAPNSIEIPSKK